MCAAMQSVYPPLVLGFMFAGFVAHVMAMSLVVEYVQRSFPLAERITHSLLPWRAASYMFALFQPNAYGLLLEARRIRIASMVRAWWIMLVPFVVLFFIAAYTCNH